MAFDEKTTFNVVAGSKPSHIKIEGHSEEFTQGAIRTLYLKSDYLSYHEHFDDDNYEEDALPKIRCSRSLRGIAKIDGDKFKIIGSTVPATRELSMSIRPIPVGEDGKPHKHEWQAVICWSAADWEIGSKDSWWCELYVPEKQFVALMLARDNKIARSISVGLKTDAWCATADWYAPVGHPITWYLKPGSKGDIHTPALVTGRITQLSWTDEKAVEPVELEKNEVRSVDHVEPEKPIGTSDKSVSKELKSINRTLLAIFWAVAFLAILHLIK